MAGGPRNATTTSRGRVYKWRDETFDSVTTILGGGIPKPALTGWAARSAAEWAVNNHTQVSALANKGESAAAVDLVRNAPWRQRDAAALKGTEIHDAVEAHILGAPQPEWSKDIAPSMDQFDRFVSEMNPTFELSEASVYSRANAHAGTLDLVAVIGGTRYLIDVKSGKDLYANELVLQLAAYRFSDFIGMPDGTEAPMPAVDACAGLLIRPRSYKFVPVIADEHAYRVFLYARQIHLWCRDEAREHMLAPLATNESPEAGSAA